MFTLSSNGWLHIYTVTEPLYIIIPCCSINPTSINAAAAAAAGAVMGGVPCSLS